MKSKKGKRIIILCITAIVVIASVMLTFFLLQQKNQRTDMERPPLMNGMGEDVISASGITSVGMFEENWDLDFLDTSLYIDESYLSTGDVVDAGTAVFHVSDETLEKARKELQDAVTETQLAYRQGVLDNQEKTVEAKTTYDNAAVSEKYAQAEYDSAVAEAKKSVEELESQVEDARELVEEYSKSINEDYYRTYYKVDELYNTYCDHFNLLMEYYTKWDIAKLEDQYSGSGKSEGAQKVSVYQSLDEMVQEESADYEEASEAYENAKKTAEAGLPKAQSDLTELEGELALAQTELDKAFITCKTDYNTTLAESENAKTVYDTTLQSLEETLATLEDEKEEASENLDSFEKAIGDGYFYTQKAGTIVMSAVREKTYLSGDAMIVAYSNPETVTISASVDQSDIADIQIGDEAYIVVSEYGNYQGIVTTINPVTQAESRSSVTYQVTVTLSGDISSLESNLTAYVYFGVTDEMMEQMETQKGAGNEGIVEK